MAIKLIFFFVYIRSMSGVKDMVGYRITLNLSYNSALDEHNSTQSCNFQDDAETSAILV